MLSSPDVPAVNCLQRKLQHRKIKVKRTKRVQRELSDIQRVFIFEQELEATIACSLSPQNADATTMEAQTTTASHALVLETHVVPDQDQSSHVIETNDWWDAASMTSCFTGPTGVGSFSEPEYENGRRYHGYRAGLYL